MYVYFDSNGTIKEVVNDKSIRKGNVDANRIYVYIEGNPEIDDIWIVSEKPDGTLTTEVSFIDNVITKAIPYDAKRDLKYFKDFTEYKFYYFDFSTLMQGLWVSTIRIVKNNEFWALGELTFNVQENVIKEDNNITESQYQYLLLSFASRTLNEQTGYDLDALIQNKINIVADNVNERIDEQDETIAGLGQLQPSGVATSSEILSFDENKGIYVSSTDGHWYYWDVSQSSYVDSGMTFSYLISNYWDMDTSKLSLVSGTTYQVTDTSIVDLIRSLKCYMIRVHNSLNSGEFVEAISRVFYLYEANLSIGLLTYRSTITAESGKVIYYDLNISTQSNQVTFNFNGYYYNGSAPYEQVEQEYISLVNISPSDIAGSGTTYSISNATKRNAIKNHLVKLLEIDVKLSSGSIVRLDNPIIFTLVNYNEEDELLIYQASYQDDNVDVYYYTISLDDTNPVFEFVNNLPYVAIKHSNDNQLMNDVIMELKWDLGSHTLDVINDSTNNNVKTVPANTIGCKINKIGGKGVINNYGEVTYVPVTSVISKDTDNETIATLSLLSLISQSQDYGKGINNSCYNYVDFDTKKYVQKVKEIKLWELNWTTSSGTHETYKSSDLASLIKKPASNSTAIIGLIKTKYSIVSYNNLQSAEFNIAVDTNGDIYVTDDSWSYDELSLIEDFEEHNVILYIELATPIETDVSGVLPNDTIEVVPSGALIMNNTGNENVPSDVDFLTEVEN